MNLMISSLTWICWRLMPLMKVMRLWRTVGMKMHMIMVELQLKLEEQMQNLKLITIH
ncbi:hypothetical protein SORBI_3002G202750 [Sorghum bicolor]|uniref:Uncharacterized protein n=1 Tax=Sorghum bicolor TaxID=4558 RepID=A0A1W0W516_SORBI|nr:hypothetical protein SORBI_3002G202750 [Sorghum bicolor]